MPTRHAAAEVPVELTGRPLHPSHGIHAPRPAPPARRNNSYRRTSTIDTIRPGDIVGEAVQIGIARDIHTTDDGSVTVLAESALRTRFDWQRNYELIELSSDQRRAELAGLVGASVSSGFRAAMGSLVPDERAGATLLHLLLDDLPGAALVSGYAIGAAGAYARMRREGPVLQIEGLCAGFQRGGTIMNEVSAGRPSPVVTGPVATSLTDDDPEAWHELRPMGPHDMRRWRCLDVRPGPAPDAPVDVEAYFRDSHMGDDRVETVIHEYTVQVRVDPVGQTVLGSAAEAHTLPWVQCIEAVDSGRRLAGRPLAGLRPDVREQFVGTTTCTHLNDTLRSIEDVRAVLSYAAA